MRRTFEDDQFSWMWMNLLGELLSHGKQVSPRSLPIREITGVHLRLYNPYHNILHHPVRNISYRFMVAEWLWMWFGRDDVKTISQYNPNIAKFSDNGVDFNGAYGVPIHEQWNWLVELLHQDQDTRQAVLQIFKPPTHATKDVPCTINLQFLARDGVLETIANMRSSDIWLGLPYDVFNFTMLGQCMAAELELTPGPLTMHLGSSHLYESNMEAATKLMTNAAIWRGCKSPRLTEVPPDILEDILVDPHWRTRRHASEDTNLPQPWEAYARVLEGSWDDAFDHLQRAGHSR